MKATISPEKLNRFQSLLLNLRERVGGEVNYVVGSIHEDVDLNSNVSSAPVHLADVAAVAVDADVEVLNNERSLLEQINTALQRIADLSFGRCTSCGMEISEERLQALPYTPLCARCAKREA